MARGPKWLRLDEYIDTAESLRAAAKFADDTHRDERSWKWLVVAAHSAVQGSFVLTLARGSSLETLKRTHAKDWLKAYQSVEPWPKDLQLDYFLGLYRKAKKRAVAPSPSSGSFSCEARHDTAMRKLNDFRNGFIHFMPQGWSIELAGFPRLVLTCLEAARHLLWNSGAIVWPTDTLSRRAMGSANHLEKSLIRLQDAYEA